ncbi:hypothetical protein M422DRAFT_47798 [Sphaerobolus stellatus SS14]|uniref:Uncharacterized protein n=1 Tax=Sphaerobolus stellatus (strain SS14) TaxID=990650 RepID=A0A0C9VNY4_SPHS4|nr:hypothetical protein M422DRAFT_47798 [Sphaerobolus stellatus SS14]
MGKRGPKSRFKNEKERKEARKEAQRNWYQRNSKLHIRNVMARRLGTQAGSSQTVISQGGDESDFGGGSPTRVSSVENDAFEEVSQGLRELWEQYRDTIGFTDIRSLGSNWLAQVEVATTDNEISVLLDRATHMWKSADAMATKIAKLLILLLKHAIEFLDACDELEHLIVQAIYVYREAMTFLQIGREAYLNAAKKHRLFWQVPADGGNAA